MRILIADDDLRLLEVMQSYLCDRGHEVEIAVNGLECVIVLREFQPEILLLSTDLLWGGADGVLAELQADASLAMTTVLLIEQQRQSVVRYKGGQYPRLFKPIHFGELTDAIEQCAFARFAQPRTNIEFAGECHARLHADR